MPELPEVETVRRGLEPAMVGARIQKVEMRRKDIRFPFPLGFRGRLTGRRIAAVARRGKYLLFQLDGGETLIAHLGMSGSFRVEAAETTTPGAFHHERSKDPKHDHVVLHLDNGRIVTYNDPRRFGFMDLVASEAAETHPRLIGLGEEPLAAKFDAQRLARLFAGSRSPLKSALLDQKRVAGLGNIYVCGHFFAPACRRCGPPQIWRTPQEIELAPPMRWSRPSARCSRKRSKPAARPCATIAAPMESWVISSTDSRSTTGKACAARDRVAAERSGNSNNPVGRRSIVRYARSNA